MGWATRTHYPLPITHYPPLYPLLLALAGFGKFDPLDTAKVVNAVIFGANLTLVGLILRRINKNSWIALFGVVAVLTSDTMIHVHSKAWTEPAFIFFCLATYWLFGRYVQTKKRSHLIAVGLVAGLATMTRYVGVTLIGATMLAILLHATQDRKRGWTDLLLFTAVSIFPLSLWLIRNSLLTNSATNRTITFHPVQWTHIQSALETFSLWLLPAIRLTSTTGIGFILIVIVSAGIHYKFKRPLSGILTVSGLFILIYSGFLLFSISFIDAHTPLDFRILSPIYFASLLWILSALDALLPPLKNIPFVRVLPMAVSLAYVILSIITGSQFISGYYLHGHGYTSQFWRQSELIKQVQLLPDDALYYSNAPDVIQLLTGKIAHGIPVQSYATTRLANESYTGEYQAMLDDIAQQNGKIIYFNHVSRWYLPSKDEIIEDAPWSIFFDDADGTIYEYTN